MTRIRLTLKVGLLYETLNTMTGSTTCCEVALTDLDTILCYL